MHISRYTILSEKLSGGGHVLMNGLTGALDLISDNLATLLLASGQLRSSGGRLYEERAAQQLNPQELDVMSELPVEVAAALKERGFLTDKAPEEERRWLSAIADAMHEHDRRTPSFLIIPNLDCNYRCSYCFERPIQNAMNAASEGAKRKYLPLAVHAHHELDNVVMNEQTVDAAFRAIEQLSAASPGWRRQIILYGGEPLDKANRWIVQKIVNAASHRGYPVAAITNGHDLEHFLDLLGEGGIQQIQISIDGPKPVHDKRRPHVGKESSFDKIIANIARVLSRGGTLVQIRSHVEPSNIEQFADLLQQFDALGWMNHDDVLVYANTVYHRDAQGQVFVGEEHSRIARSLSEVTRKYDNVFSSAPELNVMSQLFPMLRDRQPYRLRSTYCSANTGQYIFSPDGYIYSCWESVGRAGSRVGAFTNGLELKPSETQKWFTRHSGRIDACSRCPFGLVCGGGCAQYAEYNNGTPLAPYCDDFDALFRAALAKSVDGFIAREIAISKGEAIKFGRLQALLYDASAKAESLIQTTA